MKSKIVCTDRLLLPAGFILLLLMIFVSSCKHDIPQPAVSNGVGNGNGNGGGGGGGITYMPCDSDSVYFNQQVLPFLVANCAMTGCHDAGTASDGIVLNSYQALMNSDIVKPGDPTDSDLIEAITNTDPDDKMPPPPAAPLSAAQINLIAAWISQGAQNLSCDDACDTSNVTWTTSVKPIIQQKCQGCHQGASPSGGVRLETYNEVRIRALDGSLRGTVEHQSGWKPMPDGAPRLPDCDLAKIRIWVSAGAPNN
jgi:mono/diheme cytochrome c family protein